MRLFVAIELSHGMKRALGRIIDGLAEFDRNVRWVQPEQMHVTLKFLGEVRDGEVERACEAAEAVAATTAPFTMAIDTCGCFPPGGAVRVIWGGMKEAPPQLLDCAARCEAAFEALGFARESRPFAAHMTIGRAKKGRPLPGLREALSKVKVSRQEQRAERLTVMRSVLGREGARYEPVARYGFGAT